MYVVWSHFDQSSFRSDFIRQPLTRILYLKSEKLTASKQFSKINANFLITAKYYKGSVFLKFFSLLLWLFDFVANFRILQITWVRWSISYPRPKIETRIRKLENTKFLHLQSSRAILVPPVKI